ncbi:MAG: DUF1214 domain-containing protein [Pseudomonadales bacterium]|jgi:hypothetical protein|nr:DUF1214 domain-containing protein [Pseudomonadales bacterium]MCP5319730.1 DUF1214 domain-containing protein [Pseudomonadales bacterium]MCP5338322.1 DUF1214 domain-containing protein [Pseudomonadales bacterium]
MVVWNEQLEDASEAWRRWCRTLESVGLQALRQTITHDEIDLAEGLRHMGRMARLVLQVTMENRDSAHPYLWRSLGPDLKMGGDNPQGLYLAAPINGSDTFRVHGTRGSARWMSFLTGRTPAAVAAGEAAWGAALFSPDLQVGEDGRFEIMIAPTPHAGNWLRSDAFSATLMIRQFFGTPDDVRPMDIRIENLTRGDEASPLLVLDGAIAGIDAAAAMFAGMVPAMQSELIAKGTAKNRFATDIGDPTSRAGGVPGGNSVTARWALEPSHALLVEVTPPTPCAYWDAQVGNGWYESFDYRNRFSGLTCEQAHLRDDGSLTLVVAQEDPGTVNWLETAHHREGHIAIRWQLSEGNLPIPRCRVVDVTAVRELTGLPTVDPQQRRRMRQVLRTAFDARFRP